MMRRDWIFLPTLSLIAVAQTGCVALAIPALTSGAIVGTRLDREGANVDPVEPVAAAPASDEAAAGLAPTSPPADPAPTPAAAPAAPPVAGAIPATPEAAIAAPSITLPAFTAPAITAPLIAAPTVTASAIAPLPEPEEPHGFGPFALYGQDLVRGAGPDAMHVSAMLSDPVALDGQRRRCEAGVQPVVLIDMDPASGLTSLPRNPPPQPRLGWDLAQLRAAGITIAWLTDRPVEETAELRSALARSGLDPRGADIVSLRRDEADLKHQRRDNLAANACIVAIAGDERSDFDERFRYLKSPEAGAGLEPIIGNGWFLVEPVFNRAGDQAK